jgi:succinate dehydrogenase/fumarate reductase flavoprotein subunit
MCCSVTGARAGWGAVEHAESKKNGMKLDDDMVAKVKKGVYAPAERKGGFSPQWTSQVLKNALMPYYVLFVKHEKRLKAALGEVETLRDKIVPKLTARDPHDLRLAQEAKNMVLNAEMKLRASMFRTYHRIHRRLHHLLSLRKRVPRTSNTYLPNKDRSADSNLGIKTNQDRRGTGFSVVEILFSKRAGL